ncbi:MAG TPA: hypothetical protein VFH51_06720, partial [Myxococcota bacterium]|nr:hypothetical protein [Myxococcota bacterium]
MKVLRSLRVPLDDADLLRCCASLGRARQLRRAGLRKEAETLLKSAATRAPKLGELRSLPATTVDVWADVGPVSDVLTLAGETPRLLPLAVARAFMEQQVGLVGRLAAGHPLAPYASAMGEAATAMAAGDWDAAAQALRDAPRQSPLGPWRVFSKVMASFLAGDLQAVRRGIATLPDDFAMMPVCRGLIPSEDTSGPNHLARLLHPRLAAKADVAAVVAAGHDGPAARLEAHLAALLSSVGGDDSSAWCSALELLAAMLRKRAGSLKPLLQVAKRKVQAQHPAEGAKLALLAARSPGSSDFWDAVGTYLRALGADFPDVEAQSLAKAHVLEHVARGIDARCTPARFFWTPLARDALAPHLDPTLANGEDWLVGVAAASVRNDPGGFERARFLMELLRDDPVPLTPVLEDTLRAVAEACPHEPGPWLALAHLFYGKRAYRRAEAAIARAAQIAPYDNAALAMQAGSHVVSA